MKNLVICLSPLDSFSINNPWVRSQMFSDRSLFYFALHFHETIFFNFNFLHVKPTFTAENVACFFSWTTQRLFFSYKVVLKFFLSCFSSRLWTQRRESLSLYTSSTLFRFLFCGLCYSELFYKIQQEMAQDIFGPHRARCQLHWNYNTNTNKQ